MLQMITFFCLFSFFNWIEPTILSDKEQTDGKKFGENVLKCVCVERINEMKSQSWTSNKNNVIKTTFQWNCSYEWYRFMYKLNSVHYTIYKAELETYIECF